MTSHLRGGRPAWQLRTRAAGRGALASASASHADTHAEVRARTFAGIPHGTRQHALAPLASRVSLARIVGTLRVQRSSVAVCFNAQRCFASAVPSRCRTDVLRRLDDPEVTAEELMSCYVFSLPWDSTVERAAALMVLESVGQLVVVNDRDEVIGVVTSLDIARQVAMRAGYLAA